MVRFDTQMTTEATLEPFILEPPTTVVYTIQQAADQLGTSKTHVYRLINTGTLRSVDISVPGSGGTKTRILPEDLYTYVKSLGGDPNDESQC